VATLKINGRDVEVPPAWAEASLLTFLRDQLGLTGTKYGCGGGFCGACTVHVNGQAARSCLLSVSLLGQASVTTIEGLASLRGAEAGALHPVQQAFLDEAVPQCGYCQPGQVMTASAFLAGNPQPTEAEVALAMDGNLCRCGTHARIRRAVLRAARAGGGDA